MATSSPLRASYFTISNTTALPRLLSPACPAACRVGRTARAGRPGWSLSFVTQYDIELVQQIEGLVGQQLGEYKAEEGEVLKGITKVGGS